MSCSRARSQWFPLLGMIEETGLTVLLSHRKKLKFALVPHEVSRGAGIGITKRGHPVAALVRLIE